MMAAVVVSCEQWIEAEPDDCQDSVELNGESMEGDDCGQHVMPSEVLEAEIWPPDEPVDIDDPESISSPYEPGPFPTIRIEIPADGDGAPPRPLLVFAPAEPGVHPLVLFQHGFLMSVSHYQELLDNLASHGFVVVAPQMYPPGGLPIGKPTAAAEAAVAAEVLDWTSSGLEPYIDGILLHERTGIAGHSRGGKVAWHMISEDPSRVSAFAGLDPVDGSGGPLGTEPSAFATSPGLPLPTVFLGAGLGPLPAGLLQIPCAPVEEGHLAFFDAAAAPSYHVVAPAYGHNDVLDAETPGCSTICSICPSGPDDGGMRRLASGLLVAFFGHTLLDREQDRQLLTDPDTAPVEVEMQWKSPT